MQFMAGFVCLIYTPYTYKIYYKCNTCIEVDRRDKRDTKPNRDVSCKLETDYCLWAVFSLYFFTFPIFYNKHTYNNTMQVIKSF